MPAEDQFRSATPMPADDVVIVFRMHATNIRGRLVRLGPALDGIVARHAMPNGVGRLLSEALALAALCGSALPAGGNLNFQVRCDGAVSILVADYDAGGQLRGYARYDAAKRDELEQLAPDRELASILGDGHLAITLDAGAGEDRYQGVLAFEGQSLAAATAAYFQQRENMPTLIRLAIADHYVGTRVSVTSRRWQIRVGGLMVQSLSSNVGETDDGSDDDWRRAAMLAQTVEDHELLDPELATDRLLLRLFHEEAIAVEKIIPLTNFCRCSREKIQNVLAAFGAAELSDMRDDDGSIVVTCEFCATRFEFSLDDIGVRR